MRDRGYLVGLIGSGIGPSLSPPLHHREADALGLRYLYRRWDLDELDEPPETIPDLLASARRAGYDGLNITHPCKQLVIPHLDELSPEARTLQAVNTVVFDGHAAAGHNTDWSGFARGLDLGLPGAPLDQVVLLGAGGAGTAVAYALLTLGAGSISVFDAAPGRADQLVGPLRDRFGHDRIRACDEADLAPALRGADGLVHATPTGMAAHPGLPVPVELLRAELWVADVVYRPLETALLSAARARGCRCLDGGPMAVFQAAEAFHLFTGIEPDSDRMLRHFDALTRNTPEGQVHVHQ